MIAAQPAAVRPRVTHDEIDDAMLLEDEVRARLESRESELIELVGLPGSGKSTAIAHLAHVFAGQPDLLLADRPTDAELQQLIKAADRRLVICASPGRLPAYLAQRWWLRPWTQDECIEYLLGTYRERCAAVMGRITADADAELPGGLPELWIPVLDGLAADERLSGVKAALRQAVYQQIASSQSRMVIRECCFTAICQPEEALTALAKLSPALVSPVAYGLLRHAQVQMLLAAEHLAQFLFLAPMLTLLERRLPRLLVRETAELIRDNTQVVTRLEDLLQSDQPARQAMAASLLHATGHSWRPSPACAPMLAGAYLARIQWPGVCLARVDWTETDLSHADLTQANLDGVFAYHANLTGVRLLGAELKLFSAAEAALAGADLSDVRAVGGEFRASDLRSANLEDAILIDANFAAANLSGGHCRRADLSGATLTNATIEGADFTAANFTKANLRGLTLRLAEFTAARFAGALLSECDLEYMRLPGANFAQAQLDGARLTGSQMPGACFHSANLRSTGLAEIDWERADLSGADLSHCTFHLGSSRSGLVGSPIASEGSRTGFYTDEYHEQDFKSPEEIRKANLRGADLRGAKISGVDFYLVDLRDALYTFKQEEHFRRCGAILEARVC